MKKKKTTIKIEKSKIRKPKKPRGLGSGFHKNPKDKRVKNKFDREMEDYQDGLN